VTEADMPRLFVGLTESNVWEVLFGGYQSELEVASKCARYISGEYSVHAVASTDPRGMERRGRLPLVIQIMVSSIQIGAPGGPIDG
jgi:hypothetical protein